MAKSRIEVQTRITNDGFGKFAATASGWLGSKWAFAAAVLIIVVWAATGPLFYFLEYLATGDQHGYDHCDLPDGLPDPEHAESDARAINLKLNELIRAGSGRDQMIDIENLSDLELDELHASYEKIKKERVARENRE